jgi:hypothetical protein
MNTPFHFLEAKAYLQLFVHPYLNSPLAVTPGGWIRLALSDRTATTDSGFPQFKEESAVIHITENQKALDQQQNPVKSAHGIDMVQVKSLLSHNSVLNQPDNRCSCEDN